MKWHRASLAVWMAIICWCAPLMGAQEAPSCGQWNTEEFFETATAKDVTACLADGAAVGDRGESGITPLHWAAHWNENPTVVQALLAAGADAMPSAESGGTLLHPMLNWNVNPFAPIKYGETPLHRAALFNENLAVTQALLAAGADPMARTESGVTPLHLAAGFNGNLAVTQALLAAGADPMARTESGDETPLHWAADSGSPAVVQALLAAGADAMMRTAMGRTPWAIAQDNEKLKGTDAYWLLNDARFNAPGPVKSPSGGP